MKINIHSTEQYTVYIVRNSVEIDTDDYKELEGMSEDEIKDYIRSNYHNMESTKPEYYSDLSEQLLQSNILREKICGEENCIIFE